MAKMMNMLLLFFAIECGLVLFVGCDFPGSTLYDWVSTGSSGELKDYIDEMFALGGIAIIVGTIWTKSDFLIFAGIASVFFSFGIASLFELWRYLASKSLLGGTEANPWVAILFISPMILMMAYVTLKFWRNSD